MASCDERCAHGVQCHGEHEQPGEHYEWADCHCCGSKRSVLHVWSADQSCDGGEE